MPDAHISGRAHPAGSSRPAVPPSLASPGLAMGMHRWLAPDSGPEGLGPGRADWPFPPRTPPQTGRLVVRAEPRAAHRAREFTHKQLANWGLELLTADAEAIASELFTNALTHATSPVRDPVRPVRLQLVFLRHRRCLEIVMTDPSPRPPALAPDPGAAALAETGRGLYIIGALSRRWGWTRLAAGGKAVWAMLAIPNSPAP